MKFLTSFCLFLISWPAFGANETNSASAAAVGGGTDIDQTNILYVIDDGSFYVDASGRSGIDPQKREAAKTNRESLPAKDFPEGNWGELTNGLQVSLRLEKQTYARNESVKTVVLVRDVKDCSCIILYANYVSLGVVNYHVFQESGGLVGSKPKYVGLRSPSSSMFSVNEGMQCKFIDRLNDTYDLTNGSYFVQASISGYRIVGTNRLSMSRLPFEARSAKVPIQIK